MKYYVCRSLALANYLVRQGFDIKKIDDSRANSKFKICLFLNSPQLEKCVEGFNK
jgi:hypothetical protein